MKKSSPISTTCIGVLKMPNGKLIMAGDRRMSWGFSQAQKMPGSKVIKRQGLLLGGTGSCYLLTILSKLCPIPDVIDKLDDEMVETFVHTSLKKEIHDFLVSQGFGDKDSHLIIPGDLSIELLIGIRGRLFSVIVENADSDTADARGIIVIDEVNLPYATGCGGQLAWGALLESEDSDKTPKERLRRALKAAAEVSPGCDKNITFVQED